MNEELNKLLAAHSAKEDDVDLEKILDLLSKSTVFVPGVDARTKDTYAMIHEQNLLKKLDMPLLPDLLKAPDGRAFYPAFTDKAAAGEEYASYFEWLDIPFLELCTFASESEISSELIINPFTDSLILPADVVWMFAASYVPDSK